MGQVNFVDILHGFDLHTVVLREQCCFPAVVTLQVLEVELILDVA